MTPSHMLFVAVLLGSSAAAEADGAKLLFAGTKGKISQAEKRDIFSTLGYEASPDGKHLISRECGEIPFRTIVTDLNGDGTAEVMVFSGNTCTSGYTTSSVHLFMKDRSGRYQAQLGFPAFDYVKLKEKSHGFPDLLFGGPGFCQDVWRWNGQKYKYRCSQEEEPSACSRKLVTTVCKPGS